MQIMFKGEKTPIFWAGLLILSFSSWVLFAAIWDSLRFANWDVALFNNLHVVVGGIYFILLGLVMVKSGIKRKQPLTTS